MPGAVDKLQKLRVNAYSDPQRNQQIGSFEALFNPQSLQQRSTVNYSPAQGINTSGRSQQYSFTPPKEISFKLILDSTGPMFLELKGATVASEIERFQALTLNYNGEIHQPNFLSINWCDLGFNCRLLSLDIKYTLFDQQGQVLNAELDCTFIADETDKTLVEKENKQSPDMTHVRYIDAASSLTLIANEIYQTPTLYLALAEYNQLNNFRNLPHGQRIVCPPLEQLL